jgi:hypothetical protein
MDKAEGVPAAQGQVKAKSGDNGNTLVEVDVKHLAHPKAVNPDADTYVVWAQEGDGGPVQNLGALQVDKNLEGKLKTVTPLKHFSLFITPEPSATADTPSGAKTLWTTVDM